MTATEIAGHLDLNERGRDDFLDALVSLHLLARDGHGPGAVYANTPETAIFLDKSSPAYVGGILEMADARLYSFWGSLTEALHTGLPQDETKTAAPGLFEGLYADPVMLENFLDGMTGLQIGNFTALCQTLDLSAYTTYCDLGGGNGTLAAMIAAANPQLRGVMFDLPPVVPIAQANLTRHGLADRVSTVAGNFFTDELPSADVYFMGNILHDWEETERELLIHKAYAGLPPGGILVVIENIIGNERRTNTFGLLMSLNMLIETPAGSDYTGTQFDKWARTAGFARTEIRHLAGPSSAAIAYKNSASELSVGSA